MTGIILLIIMLAILVGFGRLVVKHWRLLLVCWLAALCVWGVTSLFDLLVR